MPALPPQIRASRPVPAPKVRTWSIDSWLAQRSLTTPFKHTEQLGAARGALAAVDAQLAIPAALPEPAPAPHRPEHTAYPETGPHSPGPGDTGPSWNR